MKNNTTLKIVLNIVPLLLMILLIPLVKNDYVLTGFYVGIIMISLLVKYEKKDILFLIIGFVIMMISEGLFISTGVETFNRNSLFNLMPVWLPFLWAYAFVAMKRLISILV